MFWIHRLVHERVYESRKQQGADREAHDGHGICADFRVYIFLSRRFVNQRNMR